MGYPKSIASTCRPSLLCSAFSCCGCQTFSCVRCKLCRRRSSFRGGNFVPDRCFTGRWCHLQAAAWPLTHPSQPAMQPPPDPSGLPHPAFIDAVSLHADTDSSFIPNRPFTGRRCHLHMAACSYTHLPQPAMRPPPDPSGLLLRACVLFMAESQRYNFLFIARRCCGLPYGPWNELRRMASCWPRTKTCWRAWLKGGTHRGQLDPVHKGALARLRGEVPASSKPHFSPCSALLCTQAQFVSTSIHDLTAHA